MPQIADLRASIRTASDETTTLTSPASTAAATAQALGEATESLGEVRQIAKQMLGTC